MTKKWSNTTTTTTTTTNNNNNNNKTYFSLNIRPSPFAVSVYTLQSPIYTSSSPCPILPCLVTAWWPSYCYKRFLPLREKSKCSYELYEMSYFYDFEKSGDFWRSETNFAGHQEHNSLNPIQPRLSRENRVEWYISTRFPEHIKMTLDFVSKS